MDTPLLFFVVFAAMALTSAGLARAFPSVASAAATSTGRYQSLDALRGLLASSVLIHHARIAREFFATGIWEAPASALYRFAGNGAVALFFMATGLLFWGKAIDGRLRFVGLMRSRLRRIMPLYLFSVALVLIFALARADFEMRVPASALAVSIARWLAGGLLGRPSIDGVRMVAINGDVTWTLQYEWLFYLALVPMAYFARPRRFVAFAIASLAIAAAFALAGLSGAGRASVALPFLSGMAAAHLVRSPLRHRQVNGTLASVGVAANVVAVVALYEPGRESWLHLLLTPAFVLIALGNDVFGLFRGAWMRWLGHISFSVYLLHGIVLLACLTALDAHAPIRFWSDATYIGVCAGIGVGVVLFSSLTYLGIERPFLHPTSSPRRPLASTSSAS